MFNYTKVTTREMRKPRETLSDSMTEEIERDLENMREQEARKKRQEMTEQDKHK